MEIIKKFKTWMSKNWKISPLGKFKVGMVFFILLILLGNLIKYLAN